MDIISSIELCPFHTVVIRNEYLSPHHNTWALSSSKARMRMSLFVLDKYTATEYHGDVLALWLRIREVPGSNLGPGSSYLTKIFRDFLQAKSRIMP
jgi:hypothetical protein